MLKRWLATWWTKRPLTVADCSLFAGMAAVSAGVGLIYQPAGLIVAGMFAILIGVLLTFNEILEARKSGR